MDPDVDLRVPPERAELSGRRGAAVLAVISAGGAAGASARYAISLAWPSGGGFPWSTLGVNVLGSALIGVLMVLIGAGGRWAHPLVRPFAGVGVLGGFTTFSAYALETHGLLEQGRLGLALLYASGTAAGCVAAVWLAVSLTRAALGPGSRART
ncbi:CrcB family protein [Streptomyces sp. CAU 1734]|uniref:fluoride efflux transporter FluC n=1 Tax=Streptomyces sp. CAU 1734 TaxID=3140360 RepID=UPI00326141E7